MARAGVILAMALCIATGAAAQGPAQRERAGEVDAVPLSEPRLVPVAERIATIFARPAPRPSRAELLESRLVTVERTTEVPAHWTGDIAPHENPFRPHPFFARRLEEQRSYAKPFLLPSVFPETSARLLNLAGRGRGGTAAVDQYAHLALYALDVYAPLITLRGAGLESPDHFRTVLRLPFGLGAGHRLGVFFGADLPLRPAGPLAQDAGGEMQVGWAFGSGLWSAQLRGGVGNSRLLGEFDRPFRPTVLADALGSVRVSDRLRLLVQADGRRDLGSSAGAFRVWPGVRFFPKGDETVALGLSGLWWVDRAGGDWSSQRVGGMLDVGYLFF